MITETETAAHEKFVRWLDARVIRSARGDDYTTLDREPSASFWLGRIAPMSAQLPAASRTSREERLDPCAFGMRVRPRSSLPLIFEVDVSLRAWIQKANRWTKCESVTLTLTITINEPGTSNHGLTALSNALATKTGLSGLAAQIDVEYAPALDGTPELSILLVNVTPEAIANNLDDANLYECSFAVRDLDVEPYLLAALPDSFRYDRHVQAYGINCGVEIAQGKGFRTTDAIAVDRGRPSFWNSDKPQPDLRFSRLATDPIPPLGELVDAFEAWGKNVWSDKRIRERSIAERWNEGMLAEAESASQQFIAELERLRSGVELLKLDENMRIAFCLMNAAIELSAFGKYDRWRPFQIGFLLANLTGLLDDHVDRRVADVVWFATGGGKTETYLGLIITAAFFDRIRGKLSGITAWSRFPLRMLSLQQTQRFAEAIAAAELMRRRKKLGGDPMSVGFLVGGSSTPNSIKSDADASKGEPDPDDPDMPARYPILLRCPFCRSEPLDRKFNRRLWTLEHRCGKAGCPWPESALPFYIVDDEIYRFLPTAVVGTLDKAASIAMQAAMRGFVGAPWGICSEIGHGFVYAPRSTRPNGCLVPDCPGTRLPLSQAASLFAPTLRLQDELHLLRDSLGAIDAHYEALLDDIQMELGGPMPKIVGSSATLAGFEKQVDVLYRRPARVFPVPGPTAAQGFWSTETHVLARRFVALAPRGATIEFAVDRTLTEVQSAIRELAHDAKAVCSQAGIDPSFANAVLSRYGIDVVYGNTLRDIDAVTRSFETQIRVDGPLNTATLTGRTPFDEVGRTLARLNRPEEEFKDRVHLVAASAMMSHGVDVDRLNVLIMMGFPLTTSEFIQTSARVGRTYPGLVFVIPRMARERDAGIYRAFEHFVRQGDRFVESIPITRRSRRVLGRTLPGLFLARLRHIHEPASGRSLATLKALLSYITTSDGFSLAEELKAIRRMLSLNGSLDEPMLVEVESWLEEYFTQLRNPHPEAKFPTDLMGGDRPMISLRDVEASVPVFSKDR
jgi:hypothetical protein